MLGLPLLSVFYGIRYPKFWIPRSSNIQTVWLFPTFECWLFKHLYVLCTLPETWDTFSCEYDPQLGQFSIGSASLSETLRNQVKVIGWI